MKTDRYTKAILTLIAVALCIIALRMDLRDKAFADVAGMGQFDLQHDYNFKAAVESIVEDCSVSSDTIDC